MRLAGTLPDQHDAATLVDYLSTLGIAAKPERNGDAWEIWIRDEDRAADAKRELAEFQGNRGDEKYRAAVKVADRQRDRQVDAALAARRRSTKTARAVPAVLSGRRPLTMLLLTASTVVFVLSDLGAKTASVNDLRITEIRQFDFGPGYFFGLPEIRKGEIWRLFSPMLIHYGVWHYLFNMLMLFLLGSEVEGRRGTPIFAALVALSAAACSFGEYLWSGPGVGGMSGVNYGLFGYMLLKSKYQPWLGFQLPTSTIFMMTAWLFLCMTGWMGPVANVGHVCGLAAGVVFAAVPTFVSRSPR